MRCVCSSVLLRRSEVVIFNGVKATSEATGQPCNLTRGVLKFWAENRVKDEAAFATLVIPLGPRIATRGGN